LDKLNMLSTGEKLIAGAAILLLLDSFIFPWYSVDIGIAEFTANAWEAPGAIWSILAVLIGIVLAVAVLGPKFGNMQMPALPNNLTMGQIFLGGGVLAFIFLVLKFINESDYVAFGFWLGFLLTAAIAAGGYLLYAEEKTGVHR
jgi:uncharacterized integral membrane protein